MLTKTSFHKSHGGDQLQYTHSSAACRCEMRFSIYLPPQAKDTRVPVLYWLSGLSCNDENFVQKAGAQAYAAKYGIALVVPDTSPRGDGVPDASDGGYDLGLGAGFYLNATQAPWNVHYHMYDYVVDELPGLVSQEFPVDRHRVAISGHSMGGHGALMIALRNPGRYKSVSAFSPICAPSLCPWGEKAFSAYLGPDREQWADYDTAQLLSGKANVLPTLVDQGSDDPFLDTQLLPRELTSRIADAQNVSYRLQPGYDHSYFFIATFIGDHLAFHDSHLNIKK